ncbi:pikachurin isoform X1 [Paramormyrops kingsleyae]|uniref:pikachurin isoform X1 n=1 Tax=Paramormyrops kingsleyae TaxID=1676925 RepID=UPI003B978ABF
MTSVTLTGPSVMGLLGIKRALLITLLLFISAIQVYYCSKRNNIRKSERLSPPLDVQLKVLNCTAFRVQWKTAQRHTSTVAGYKVFYTEMMKSRPASPAVTVDLPLNLDTLTTRQFGGEASFDVEIGDLRAGTEYRVSVAAYGWAGEGRPSKSQDIRTSSQDTCMPPSPPSQPKTTALSATKIALSWRQDGDHGSAPVNHFQVAYIRPELDTEWTSIKEPTETNSVVVKGLVPDTLYQFEIRAVNQHGISPPSTISDPVWTFSAGDVVSGGHAPSYITHSHGEDGGVLGVDDSDQGIYIKKLEPFPAISGRIWPLSSSTGTPPSEAGSDTVTRELATNGVVTTASTPPTQPFTSPSHTSTSASSLSISTPLHPAHSAPVTRKWTGSGPPLHNLPCGEIVCPANSFCINDLHRGGSRCHCSLGRGGDTCTEEVSIQFPRFHGSSYLTFEPLKKSSQVLRISLEFKTDMEDGMLLYCGENEHGRGDFTSLSLVHNRLHFRFDCGTGPARIMSRAPVVPGQWHSVTIYRDGPSGWLELDGSGRVLGRSQGNYTKITFHSPLYVGGSPNAYGLARAVGTSQGFQGCIQTLSINAKTLDLRPWPRGLALGGTNVGECREARCGVDTCANGGMCFSSQTSGSICLCPLGFRGPLCQEYFLLSLPHFNESLLSYFSAPWPQSSQHYLSFMEFEITFFPTSPDGTLLYSEDTGSRDFLSVTLADGSLEFRFDCGSGPAILRSKEPISIFGWHELRVSRTAKSGILQVDNQIPIEGIAEGAFTQINCNTPLYVGGVPNYISTKSSACVLRPFSGSIQKILLNDHVLHLTQGAAVGVNVENARHPCIDNPCANGGTCRPRWDEYECDCPLGYDGRHCQKECGNHCLNMVTDAIETPQFIGRSYLTYDKKDILRRVSGSRTNVFMRFKSTAKDGLLLWRGDGPMRVNTDFLSLGLQDGAIVFSYNLGSGIATVMVNGTFGDGRWHRVKAVRDGPSGKLTVDDYGAKTGRSPGKMRQLNIHGGLYVGGLKEIALHTNKQYMQGLVGCISHFILSTDYHLSLVEDATDGKNINTCGN